MPTVEDRYEVPKSWDDLDGEYIENGDYAGWVDAIRAAMMERVEVCLHGIWGGTQLRNKVTSLGYFQKTPVSMPARVPHGYRGDCELYDFAKRTEILLDTLLTPNDEFGTNDNRYSPWGEDGYFVDPDPNYWLKRTDYADDLSETGSSTLCYVKYLNMERMFEDDSRNYKLALNGVASGDFPSKFVPFFNAVKNALNYMTVIPVQIRYVRASTAGYSYDENIGVVHSELLSGYNDDMQEQPNPADSHHFGFHVEFNNYCQIHNWADPEDRDDDFSGNFRWTHIYPCQVATSLPPISFDLYRAFWAEKSQVASYDNNELAWASEYTPGHELITQINGVGHFIGGDDAKRIGGKFPNDSLMFPITPGRETTNVKGYDLNIYHFADFNVAGGFNFRGEQ